ncbi:MAG TPA: hypothetical protein PKE65_03290, partial [Rhizobiaceae bacterium]|nr:hypothetical protein [Rhizobiaceae bacterium]
MLSKSRQLAAQRAYSATIGRGARSLAVTGSSPKADASEFAFDIAAAGAAFGRRVLLVRARNRDFAALEPAPLDANIDSVWAATRQDRQNLFEIVVPAGTALHAVLNDGQRLP